MLSASDRRCPRRRLVPRRRSSTDQRQWKTTHGRRHEEESSMAAAAERLNRTPEGDRAKPKGRMVNGNITLGRFGGVEVRINWSWLVIFALIVWSLADGVFPSPNPGLSRRLTLPHIPGAILATKSLQISGIGVKSSDVV